MHDGSAATLADRFGPCGGDATTRSARVPMRLAPGVYFWRAQGSATARPFRIDGRHDVAGCSRRLTVWLGRRAPLPERPDHTPPLPTLVSPLLGAAGDLDGDGRVDWLGFGPPAAVLLASSRVPLMLPAAPSSPLAATAVGDVNGDGFDDVVAGAPSAGIIYVLHGGATDALTRAETLRGDALEECGRSVL